MVANICFCIYFFWPPHHFNHVTLAHKREALSAFTLIFIYVLLEHIGHLPVFDIKFP